MNTNTPKPPKVVVAPEGCNKYFTAGKEYVVFSLWSENYDETFGYRFTILCDKNVECFCFENLCNHLNFGNWIIKEREQ